MLKYQFIPAQSGFYSFALPCCFKLGNSVVSETISLASEDFYSLVSRQTGVWGVNIDIVECDHFVYRDIKTMGCNVVVKDKSCFFIGPSVVFYDDGQCNMVLGIDSVVFPEMPSDFEVDEEDELRIVDQFDPIDREPKYKVLNQGFFDYSQAVEQGNGFLKRYGIRTGSNVGFYGKVEDVGENFEVVMVVAVPNNRMLNPCCIKTLLGTPSENEEDLMMFLSEIAILGKDYSNFYMFKEKLDPGKYMVGVFDLSAVLVQYHVDTSVRLVGTHDHHENSGIERVE